MCKRTKPPKQATEAVEGGKHASSKAQLRADTEDPQDTARLSRKARQKKQSETLLSSKTAVMHC